MRLRTALLVLTMALATITFRYGPPGARTFTAVLPVSSTFALPIALNDRTGRVSGFEVGEPDPFLFGDIHSGQVVATPDRPLSLFVQWFSGCEDYVEITVEGIEKQLDVRVRPGRSFSLLGHTCLTAAVPHAVIVDFVRAVDPTNVQVDVHGG